MLNWSRPALSVPRRDAAQDAVFRAPNFGISRIESGLDLAEHAKTLGVPSLLMSAEFAAQMALQDDGAFIGKPFRLQELTDRILPELQTPDENRG